MTRALDIGPCAALQVAPVIVKPPNLNTLVIPGVLHDGTQTLAYIVRATMRALTTLRSPLVTMTHNRGHTRVPVSATMSAPHTMTTTIAAAVNGTQFLSVIDANMPHQIALGLTPDVAAVASVGSATTEKTHADMASQ